MKLVIVLLWLFIEQSLNSVGKVIDDVLVFNSIANVLTLFPVGACLVLKSTLYVCVCLFLFSFFFLHFLYLYFSYQLVAHKSNWNVCMQKQNKILLLPSVLIHSINNKRLFGFFFFLKIMFPYLNAISIRLHVNWYLIYFSQFLFI